MENMISIAIPYSSQEEFEKHQQELLKQAINETLTQINRNRDQEKLLSRKEVAELLHISLPTLNNLTKSGKLIGYRLQGRVLYKWSEVENALLKIDVIKYSRNTK